MNEHGGSARQNEYSKGKWLLYDDIFVGMEFPTVKFTITEELVKKYCKAMGDDNPLYYDSEYAKNLGFSRPIAPSTIVCIYAIPSALLSGYKPKIIPPPGNIHFRQEYEFFNAAQTGDIISIFSTVINKEILHMKRFVTIESLYFNQQEKKIACGKITPIWSK